MDDKPTQLFFRIVITETELHVEHFDLEIRKWINDGEMLDYWWGFEPGAEEVTPEEVLAAGVPLPDA